MNKADATNIVKIEIKVAEWYVPHYTPSIPKKAKISKQILSKVATELQYVERSVLMKEVNTQNLWSFELVTQEGITIPIWIIIGFQQRDTQDSQNLNNDTFFNPPVTPTQCTIGTEKHPDFGILLNCEDHDYSHGYGQIEGAFRPLTKDDILNPFMSGNDCRSTDISDDFGYNLRVFDLEYQKNLEFAQPK